MKILSLPIFLILAIFVSVGCGNSKKLNESSLDRSYRLIDKGRDDDAISVLNDHLDTDPDNPDYQVALASAYAHKAGFKVQKLGHFFVDTKKMSGLSDTFNLGDSAGKEISFQTDSFASSLSILLTKYAKFADIYSDIPSYKEEDSIYIEEAIKILESIKNPRQPDGLYLAVMRTIQFKHYFAVDLVGPIDKGQISAGSCILDLNAINNSILKLGHLLMSIYDALLIATPSKAKDLKARKNKISDKIFSLTLIVTGMSVADEASNIFAKQTVIEEGFGKLLTCKSEGNP